MDYPLVMGVTVLFGGRVYRRPTVVLLEAFVKEANISVSLLPGKTVIILSQRISSNKVELHGILLQIANKIERMKED